MKLFSKIYLYSQTKFSSVMDSSDIGPKPLFGKGQVKRALELIGEHGPIGRKRLADKLDVGEGSMRTILSRLKDKDLVTSSPGGHLLTDKGEQRLGDEARKFLKVDAGDLTVASTDVATLIRVAAENVDKGIEQRDEAIKVGAEGATVLVFQDGSLKLSGSEGGIDTRVESELLDFFNPSENDIIIISTADGEKDAERGALAAAETVSG